MKKIIIILILLISYSMGGAYGEGYKIYKKAKVEMNKGNDAKAKELFSQSLKVFEKTKNSSQAILKIAELYCNGWGVNKDEKKAKEYLTKAKNLGASFINDKCLKKLQN